MTATEIRNTLGFYDDPMLNAACEAERHEELEYNILKAIAKKHGYKTVKRSNVYNFKTVCEVLKSVFGFDYCWADDENEEHWFMNDKTKDEISIYPVTYYAKQADMKIFNFMLY